MDTITHGFAGSMITRSFSDRDGARAAFWIGMSAAMLPDIDFIFVSNRLQYLRDHRGWTHSFLLLPFLALGVALVARPFFRQTSLRRLGLFAAIAIATHILFDWMTSFGTMFWTPISRTRYSLDWVFILDPIFTGVAVVALAPALLHRSRARRIAATGSIVLAAYIGFCALLHAKALEVWRRMDHPPAGARVAALPQFLSPFRWLGLSESGDEVHVAFFDIGPFARGKPDPRPPEKWTEVLESVADFYPPPERASIRRFARPPDSPVLRAARALPDVEIYLAFARFPLETVYPEKDGGATFIVQDVRFLPWFSGPWERGGRQGVRHQPFVYRVRFDAALRPLDRGFVRGGRLR
jgi:inner membrane protein